MLGWKFDVPVRRTEVFCSDSEIADPLFQGFHPGAEVGDLIAGGGHGFGEGRRWWLY